MYRYFNLNGNRLEINSIVLAECLKFATDAICRFNVDSLGNLIKYIYKKSRGEGKILEDIEATIRMVWLLYRAESSTRSLLIKAEQSFTYGFPDYEKIIKLLGLLSSQRVFSSNFLEYKTSPVLYFILTENNYVNVLNGLGFLRDVICKRSFLDLLNYKKFFVDNSFMFPQLLKFIRERMEYYLGNLSFLRAEHTSECKKIILNGLSDAQILFGDELFYFSNEILRIQGEIKSLVMKQTILGCMDNCFV